MSVRNSSNGKRHPATSMERPNTIQNSNNDENRNPYSGTVLISTDKIDRNRHERIKNLIRNGGRRMSIL